MAAEGMMNNRKAQSAVGPRAAETYIVDLTSVCLSSGTVRLPLSLLGRFSEGQHRVTADGEELTIEFEAPRTLTGLTPFFLAADLRANDRVRFVFDGERLELKTHKRERPRAASSAAHSPVAAFAPSSAKHDVSQAAASNGSARLTQRGLFAEPAQLIEASIRAADNGEPTEAESAAPALREAEKAQPETTIKAVRRVRIEGGVPPRADTAAPRPLDRASAHDVWARRQHPAWRALDTMVAGPVVDPEEAAEAFSESIVRVVRRSKGTVTPLAAEMPPVRPKVVPEEQEARAPMSYSMSWPLPETPREKPRARPADVPVPAPHLTHEAGVAAGTDTGLADTKAYLDPYLDSPINADLEEYAESAPAILESDLLSLPTSGRWRTASEEAYLKYQTEQQASAQEPVAVPAGRRSGFLGRLGLGRGREQSAGNAGYSSDQAGGPTSAAPMRPSGDKGADVRSPADEPKPATSEPVAVPTHRTSTRAHQEPGADKPLMMVDGAVYDVDSDAEVKQSLVQEPVSEGSLDSDIKALDELLNQPNVPAIVRCDDLALRLQMSPARVSRAMLRLAEDRERFTPLRGDAYMVRRVR